MLNVCNYFHLLMNVGLSCVYCVCFCELVPRILVIFKLCLLYIFLILRIYVPSCCVMSCCAIWGGLGVVV